MKILFVEDDKVIAAGLCYSLTQEGYTVSHCLNVEAAKTMTHPLGRQDGCKL